MGKLGKFQMQEFDSWAKTSKLNHINSAFLNKPQELQNYMVQLLAFRYRKTLNTFLSQYPTKVFDSDDEYTWNVIGSMTKNLPLVEARNVDNVTLSSEPVLGANGEPFYVVFEEDLFADGAIIVGELNEIYQLRILGDGYREGTNVRYKVVMSGGNLTGMPKDQLQPGKRFSKEYAPVEREFSRKVDDITFSSPVAMRNEFSTIRMQHKVSGALINKKIAMGVPIAEPTQNGGYKVRNVDMWMHYEQWVLEQQWDDAKNKLLAYGRSNRNKYGEYLDIGKSGEVIRMGSGLFQQMEVNNTSFYNDFSLKAIEDALYELSAANLAMNERSFVLKTGERGAAQFHKAVLDTVSGWQPIQVNADNLGMVKKTSSPLHEVSLSAGFQFTEFLAPNGVKLKVEVDPMYDDPVRNKITHPNGGPAYSYRYDIFDIGSMSEPNIFKVAVKDQETDITGYTWGMRNPFTGKIGGDVMSYDEDSATIHKMVTTGICVLDPTRTMSIIPALLNG